MKNNCLLSAIVKKNGTSPCLSPLLFTTICNVWDTDCEPDEATLWAYGHTRTYWHAHMQHNPFQPTPSSLFGVLMCEAVRFDARREDPDVDFSNQQKFIPIGKMHKNSRRSWAGLSKLNCGKNNKTKQDYDAKTRLRFINKQDYDKL